MENFTEMEFELEFGSYLGWYKQKKGGQGDMSQVGWKQRVHEYRWRSYYAWLLGL
jgi:hypothetical protein